MTAKVFVNAIAVGAFLAALGAGVAVETMSSASGRSGACTSECTIASDSGWQIVADSGWQVTDPTASTSASAQ
jgi:hypothetical protein